MGDQRVASIGRYRYVPTLSLYVGLSWLNLYMVYEVNSIAALTQVFPLIMNLFLPYKLDGHDAPRGPFYDLVKPRFLVGDFSYPEFDKGVNGEGGGGGATGVGGDGGVGGEGDDQLGALGGSQGEEKEGKSAVDPRLL